MYLWRQAEGLDALPDDDVAASCTMRSITCATTVLGDMPLRSRLGLWVHLSCDVKVAVALLASSHLFGMRTEK